MHHLKDLRMVLSACLSNKDSDIKKKGNYKGKNNSIPTSIFNIATHTSNFYIHAHIHSTAAGYKLLKVILRTLSHTYLREHAGLAPSVLKKGDNIYTHYGETASVDSLEPVWHVPSADECAAVGDILSEYLLPSLSSSLADVERGSDFILSFSSGGAAETVKNHFIHRLQIIRACLRGIDATSHEFFFLYTSFALDPCLTCNGFFFLSFYLLGRW